MNEQDLQSLEDKTQNIVYTLVALKDELDERKRQDDLLEKERVALADSANSLTSAVKEIEAAIELIKRSTFAQDLDALHSEIVSLQENQETVSSMVQKLEESNDAHVAASQKAQDALEAQNKSFEQKTASIEGQIDESMTRTQDAIQSLASRMDTLEKVIGRIDRNTQKGFGKEKGPQ